MSQRQVSKKPLETRRNSEKVATCPSSHREAKQRLLPSCETLSTRNNATMENISFDWHNDFNYGTPEFPTYSSSPLVELATSPATERADQPSGDSTLPLLRLGSWESSKQYDKNNPECIHYDFRWKVSQRENIRARHVYSDTDPDLVLAPSDFWKVKFQSRLESLLKDKDRFPGENYTCEETIIEISIERSRQRGMTKRCQKAEIDWKAVDSHWEGLSDLFRKGRKITFNMEFIYKEVTRDSTTARGRKKKSATDAQKLQRAAEAGLWTRVYSIIVAEPNTASKDPTAVRTNEEITISCSQDISKLFLIILKAICRRERQKRRLILISRSHPTFLRAY